MSHRATAGGCALGLAVGWNVTNVGAIADTVVDDYVRAQGGTPFAQGLYGGVALGAGGFALAAVPQLVGPLGFRAPFASAVALAVLAAIVLAAGPRDRPRHVERAARPVLSGAPGLLRDSRLYRLCVL